MRMWTVLAATVTMTLTVRDTPPSVAASTSPAAVSDAQRERTARKLVRKLVKPWVRRSDSLIVRTAIVGFNGDTQNPITGSGPIEVFVRQRSEAKPNRWDRFVRRFDIYGNRR